MVKIATAGWWNYVRYPPFNLGHVWQSRVGLGARLPRDETSVQPNTPKLSNSLPPSVQRLPDGRLRRFAAPLR